MAPVTRSSLHGRSISREGSWQISSQEDLLPQEAADRREVTGNVESLDNETAEEGQSHGDSEEDPFHEYQGICHSYD